MRFTIPLSSVLALILSPAPWVHAEILPASNIEDEVFDAELVVVGSYAENREVHVKEVLLGSMTLRQAIQVDRLLDLPRRRFDNEKQALASLGGRRAGIPEAPAPTVSGDLLLFLERDGRGRWSPCGFGAGVKWLVDGRVYGYRQLINPGGYFLLPDCEVKTEADLRKEIRKAAAKKARFAAARAVMDPKARVNALAEFVGPEEKGLYYYAAVDEITKAGSPGASFLQQQADRSEQKPRRRNFLLALGRTQDPGAVPYLLALAERVAPVVKGKGVLRQGAMAEKERAALVEWETAIYALAEIADKRAVPAFRDALLWGAVNWKESRVLESAARGLQRLPSPENIPSLARALSSIPAADYDWVAVHACLRALETHPYKEAVPVLARQLKYPNNPRPGHDPREYNARIAHQALLRIVGQDLGKGEVMWVKWFEARER